MLEVCVLSHLIIQRFVLLSESIMLEQFLLRLHLVVGKLGLELSYDSHEVVLDFLCLVENDRVDIRRFPDNGVKLPVLPHYVRELTACREVLFGLSVLKLSERHRLLSEALFDVCDTVLEHRYSLSHVRDRVDVRYKCLLLGFHLLNSIGQVTGSTRGEIQLEFDLTALVDDHGPDQVLEHEAVGVPWAKDCHCE